MARKATGYTHIASKQKKRPGVHAKSKTSNSKQAKNYKKKYGLSYLFISHDLKVIQALCHRILVMKDGKVVEEGTSGEIFRNPQTPYTRELLEAVLE